MSGSDVFLFDRTTPVTSEALNIILRGAFSFGVFVDYYVFHKTDENIMIPKRNENVF